MDVSYQSALVVLVPEAERLVGPFREKYDPVAAEGVAAHITINYPFQHDTLNHSRQIDTLRVLFSRLARFQFSLIEIRRFPNVIYLAPEPEQPFVELAQAVVDYFPESPPYLGRFGKVIPHLTVAEVEDAEKLAVILRKFQAASKGELPIQAEVKTVLFMDNQTGAWEIRQVFSLAGSKT